METLKLQLVDITGLDIKGPTTGSYGGKLPRRMKYLHPSVAQPFYELWTAYPGIAISDMWRDPIASLAARQIKQGVARPGYSGHNYGVSIDVDINQTLKNMGWTYSQLLEKLNEKGWTCHRTDGQRGSEDWHFNYLGMGPNPPSGSKGVQKWILENYGQYFTLEAKYLQFLLQKANLYHGEIDGHLGPLSNAAITAFKRAYDVDGGNDMLMRTLAIVTAEKVITKPNW